MKRSVLLAAPALAVALILSGCSSDSDSPSNSSSTSAAKADNASAVTADDVLTRIAAATSEQKSAAMELSMTGDQALSGTGVVQFGEPVLADFSMTTEVEGESQDINIRVIEGAVYLGISSLTDILGKPWVKIDPDGTDPFSAGFKPVLEQLTSSADFSDNLALLEAGTTVKEVGTETVNGAEAVKFELTTDVAEAAKASTGATADLIAELEKAGVKTLTSFLWVDSNDLPVKFEQTSDMDGASATTTVTYTSWGEPVTVEAPPADEIGDISALTGSGS